MKKISENLTRIINSKFLSPKYAVFDVLFIVMFISNVKIH